MKEIEIIKHHSYSAQLKTTDHLYDLTPTACGQAFGLFCDGSFVTEFPIEDIKGINDYILDLAYTVIVRHEEIRERIKFEGEIAFMMQTDETPIAEPVLISASVIAS